MNQKNYIKDSLVALKTKILKDLKKESRKLKTKGFKMTKELSTITIDNLQKQLLSAPFKAAEIIENFCSKEQITVDFLQEQFYNYKNIELNEYVNIVQEVKEELNEDLSDFLSSKLGNVKDAIAAKYGVGGVKQKALGSQQLRTRAEYLFNNWNRMVGKAKLIPDSKHLNLFLRAIYVPTTVANKAIKLYKDYLNPDRTVVGDDQPHLLPSGKLREFFSKVAELEAQDMLSQSAKTSKEPNTEPAQAPAMPVKGATTNQKISLQDIEKFISTLPAQDRAKFVTKNVLNKLNAQDAKYLLGNILLGQK